MASSDKFMQRMIITMCTLLVVLLLLVSRIDVSLNLLELIAVPILRKHVLMLTYALTAGWITA